MTPHINAPAGAFADAVLMPRSATSKIHCRNLFTRCATGYQRAQYVRLYRNL